MIFSCSARTQERAVFSLPPTTRTWWESHQVRLLLLLVCFFIPLCTWAESWLVPINTPTWEESFAGKFKFARWDLFFRTSQLIFLGYKINLESRNSSVSGAFDPNDTNRRTQWRFGTTRFWILWWRNYWNCWSEHEKMALINLTSLWDCL